MPPERNDLNRRANRRKIPARIAPRIFITGREINTSPGIERPQDLLKSTAIRDFGDLSVHSDTTACGVLELGHNGLT
jgi:hypothetical protein